MLPYGVNCRYIGEHEGPAVRRVDPSASCMGHGRVGQKQKTTCRTITGTSLILWLNGWVRRRRSRSVLRCNTEGFSIRTSPWISICETVSGHEPTTFSRYAPKHYLRYRMCNPWARTIRARALTTTRGCMRRRSGNRSTAEPTTVCTAVSWVGKLRTVITHIPRERVCALWEGD